MKRKVQKLGDSLVKIGNNLICISKHQEHLHIQVNIKIKEEYKSLKHDKGKYLERAFAIVDETVGSASVDSNFFADYYVLKSELERQNIYFIPTLLSIITSIVVSEVMNIEDNIAIPFINEIVGIILGLIVFVFICGTHRIMFSKSYNMVYPYILKKMEKKIEKHQNEIRKRENVEES